MPKLTDRFGFFLDGMNDGIEPQNLPDTQYAFGVNGTIRRGQFRTRDGFREIDLPESVLKQNFQGCIRYRLNDADRIIFAIAGHLWSLNIDTGVFIDLSQLTGAALAPNSPKAYFVQAEKYIIAQDGVNKPCIIDGDTCVQSGIPPAAMSIPIGTVMAYGHGRLFVVPKEIIFNNVSTDGRRFFLAGNILIPGQPETILKFTETEDINGGGALALPAEFGFITFMTLQRNAGGGSGYGPLIVGARNGVSAFSIQLPRQFDAALGIPGWNESDISQVLFMDTGTRSSRSVVATNNDIMFRGSSNKDGIRSVSFQVYGSQQTLQNIPLSGEMQRVFDNDNQTSLQYVSQSIADNRLISMVKPANDTDNSFEAMASLDFAPLQNLKQKASPAFDGVVTGAQFLQSMSAMYEDKERHLVFCRKADGNLSLVVMHDEEYTDNGTPIEARLYTRRMNGKNLSDTKIIEKVMLCLSDIRGDVTVSVYSRPDWYPYWVQIGATWSFSAPVTDPNSVPQGKQRIDFSAFKNQACNTIEKTDLISGMAHQFCIAITGRAMLDYGEVLYEREATEGVSTCDSQQAPVALTPDNHLDLVASDYDYRFQ